MTTQESGDSFHHLLTPTINYSHNLWPSQTSSRGPWNYETGQAGWWRIVLAISSLEPRPRPSGIQLKCDGNNFYSKSTTSATATTARAGLEGCGWKTLYEKEQRRSFPFICDFIPHFQGGINQSNPPLTSLIDSCVWRGLWFKAKKNRQWPSVRLYRASVLPSLTSNIGRSTLEWICPEIRFVASYHDLIFNCKADLCISDDDEIWNENSDSVTLRMIKAWRNRGELCRLMSHDRMDVWYISLTGVLT